MTLAIFCGFVLDLLIGDPVIPHFPHPVVVMGRFITRLEIRLRSIFPKTPEGELVAGRILALVLPFGTLAVTGLACWGGAALHPAIGFFFQTLWCWQALAIKNLAAESRNVHDVLKTGNLSAARKAVGRIVGRDTQELTNEGIIKAAVETVAENFSDGVLAPLFYMLLGGAPLAMTYKAINTMDSMVGYKNARYLYFGRAAAKLDDAANFLPARLAALFWIAASGLAGQDMRRAYYIWRRDRRNHASPNSAQCEAACAGALGIQLAGPASYFGQVYEKPTIGDDLRHVVPEDILRANRNLFLAGILALVVGLCLRTLVEAAL